MIRRILTTAMLGLALATSASAGKPTDRLRTLFDEANRILLSPEGDSASNERVSAIRALVNDVFDAREAAALALGQEWHARTPAERDEFARLYADLVEGAYLAWVGSRARVHGDGIRIAFESESVRGTSATVVTMLQTRGGGEIPIEYRMTRPDGRWAVLDVVVDGLSLAASYRAQFQRVMQTETYADLVARLKEKASPTTLAAIAVTPPVIAAPPVRVASAAPVSDAPPAETRVAPPMAAVIAAAPVVAAISPPLLVPAPRAPVADVTAAVRPRAVEPTPAPTATLPTVRKWFWIQVGAFRDIDAASRLVERLRKHSVTVATGGRRSDPLARVLVGPFANRAAAASALRELAGGGYRAFIAVE